MKVTTISMKTGKLLYPRGLSYDSKGKLLIADSGNNCIRKLNPRRGKSKVVNEKCCFPSSLTCYENEIYVADTNRNVIKNACSGEILATGLRTPCGIATDRDGNIYIADTFGHCIKKIGKDGSIIKITGTIRKPYGVAISDDGVIYTCTGCGIIAFWNKKRWITVAQVYGSVFAILIDSMRNIWFTQPDSHVIKRINTRGEIELIAGSPGNSGYVDGSLHESKFNRPHGIAMVGSTLYIVDSGNNAIRKILMLRLWNTGENYIHIYSCSKSSSFF